MADFLDYVLQAMEVRFLFDFVKKGLLFFLPQIYSMFSSTGYDITSLRVEWVLVQGYPMDRQIYVHLVYNGDQKEFAGGFTSLSLTSP